MNCVTCGSENLPGRKFCRECGSPLSSACPACGTPNPPGDKFCGECGTRLTGSAPGAPEVPIAPPREAERRVVSVLFADLVGFTTLSEARDPEEVRDLLTRYFDSCRRLVARYGGSVEKFIGDAVMAVWGTPTAQEDDAERAVRTALELTAAVAELGREIGAPDLRARVGVMTGEAAVTLGAEGQGMVAGDLVNTASRVQAAASPGTVLVGDDTRSATEAAIMYEDAGPHELKGKAGQVRLWRALRVVAGRGGALKSVGLEAPFVGRDSELRLVKELFHASAEERKARLVSVVGVAGIGKSRLSWEFVKYLDGLQETIWYHRGRCLSYGEGVAYWALAEMVRMRAGIAEAEDQASALAKLHRVAVEHVHDEEERRWIEPRLAHLLGLEERTSREPEDLFSAWRVFVERLSATHPVVLMFEDVQWADASLLDFIGYLLDWSRDHPVFVVTLARPEFTDRRPSWGSGRRNFHSLYLEPLSTEAMHELVRGLVPGLPPDLGSRIVARAEGVPLYAVEIVRMLLDRGLLVQEGNVYRPAAEVGAIEVPQTLHALIAARLDGLGPEERRVVQDASVLGKTFTRLALVAVSGLPDETLEPLLASLVRKEVLSVQADPRSPERGQYGFVQELVRTVAYETLSKRDRKARHLRAADYLERSWGAEEEEIVEVVASHFLDAYRVAPDASDAPEIRANARRMLVAAGERAASLAASGEAQRYFEQAAALADDPLEEAGLLERAGARAWSASHAEEARAHFRRAIELFEGHGHTHPAARVSARLAEVEWRSELGLEAAVERMEAAFEVLSSDPPDEDFAAFAAQLARLHFFKGDVQLAKERIDAALRVAESLWLPEVLCQGLVTEAMLAIFEDRHEKSLALMKHALGLALENDLPAAAMRARLNMAETLCRRDRYGEAIEQYDEGIALARRIGDRVWEGALVSNRCYPLSMTGRWDEALALAEDFLGSGPAERQFGSFFSNFLSFLSSLLPIHLHRGRLDEATRLFQEGASLEGSADVQDRGAYLAGKAAVLRATGDVRGALRAGEEAFAMRDPLGVAAESVKMGFVEAVEAALSLGEAAAAEALLSAVEALPAGQLPPFLGAQVARFRGRLPASAPSVGAEQAFGTAAAAFRELSMPFWLAVTLLEQGEWLTSAGRGHEAEELLAEAGRIFERLGAEPWTDRVRAARPAGTRVPAAERLSAST